MENDSEKPKPRRDPKKVTVQRLHNQALSYLDKFPTTAGKMRNILINKCKKPAEFHEQDWEEILEIIDSEIERLTKAGILNDKLYAQSKARVLARRGKSVRMIKASLIDFKIEEDNIDDAVAQLGETEQQADILSAINYVKRRKFGPYRDEESRKERREKDMTALARVGYSYEIARKVIEAPTIDQLEKLADEEE